MKIYSESSTLNVEPGVGLEVVRHYSDKEKPSVVFAQGLGGTAGREYCLVDRLAEDFHVVSFSPRNSGNSNGHYTITNHLGDLAKVIDSVSQERGELPHGVGHSMGGYVMSRLLGEKPRVKRAVLLSPLTKASEQNPKILDSYLRRCAEEDKAPLGVRMINRIASAFGLIGQQRIDEQDLLPFLKSLYAERDCDKKLLVPSYVALTGRSNFRLKIGNLDELKEKWEGLGAEVEVFPESSHWFSGTGLAGPVNEFSRYGICEKVADFLKRE